MKPALDYCRLPTKSTNKDDLRSAFSRAGWVNKMPSSCTTRKDHKCFEMAMRQFGAEKQPDDLLQSAVYRAQ